MPRKPNGFRFSQVGEDTLVFNPFNGEAHSLNKVAAFILHCCDGETTVQEVASLCEQEFECLAGEDLVRYTLEQLRRKKLVDSCDPGALTRKDLLVKAAGAAVALPVVASVVLPSPALAQSCVTDCMVLLGGGGIDPALCGDLQCNNSDPTQCATNRCFVNYNISDDNASATNTFSCTDPVATVADDDCNQAKGAVCFFFPASTTYTCCGPGNGMSGATCGVCPSACTGGGEPCCRPNGTTGTCTAVGTCT